jgi:hypothetical protein
MDAAQRGGDWKRLPAFPALLALFSQHRTSCTRTAIFADSDPCPVCPVLAQALANWIVPGIVLYLLDRSFRAWQTATNILRLAPTHVTVRGGTITLTIGWPEVRG